MTALDQDLDTRDGGDLLEALYSDCEPWAKERVSSLSPKTRALLLALAADVGTPVCVKCADIGANQPASQKRELKVNGFRVGRGQQLNCDVASHGRGTHYVLESLMPDRGTTLRADYTETERAAIKRILGARDAFTGAGSQALEIDHRVPMQRRTTDETKVDISNHDAVRNDFCLLTREHNLTKDRQCTRCVKTGKRPAFLGVSFYFEGTDEYAPEVGCGGCGWAYPERWKEELRQVLLGRLTPRATLSHAEVETLISALGLTPAEEMILIEVLLERRATSLAP